MPAKAAFTTPPDAHNALDVATPAADAKPPVSSTQAEVKAITTPSLPASDTTATTVPPPVAKPGRPAAPIQAPGMAATTAHSPVTKPAFPAPQRRVSQPPASGASLIAAIKRGATDQARALLRAGADPNVREVVAGQSPDSAASALLLALSWRADAQGRLQPPPENLPLIGALLSKGANPNSADSDGVTPLLLAVQLHYTETVRQLLRHGARVNVRDKDGRIPLSYAVESSDPNLLKTLLNRGADVNARAFGDNTPLMFAVLAGNETNVKELLHRRAKLDLTNSAGQTALSIAISHGNAHIVAILKAATPKGSR
jgi:hypothetical protein